MPRFLADVGVVDGNLISRGMVVTNNATATVAVEATDELFVKHT